jgi:vacuolar protein sorting-associated protein 13A/C
VETFIHDSLAGVHKLVKLNALSVYFDTDTTTLDKGVDDRQGTIDALRQMLAGSPKHQYILKPVTGEARCIVNKTMSKETPKVDAQVIFDEIGIVLDRDQYRDVLSVVDVFHFYRRTHQYHKFRPPEEEFQANPAKARLEFALDAISSEVHERHRRWTWDYLRDRRDTRKRYVELYVKKLALPEGKLLGAEVSESVDVAYPRMGPHSPRWSKSCNTRISASSDPSRARKQSRMPRRDGSWKRRGRNPRPAGRHGDNGSGDREQSRQRKAA